MGRRKGSFTVIGTVNKIRNIPNYELMSAKEIGNIIDEKPSHVYYVRKNFGLSVLSKSEKLANYIKSIPDYRNKRYKELSEMAGVGIPYLSYINKRYNLEHNSQRGKFNEFQRKDYEFVPLLGKFPDSFIARKYGLTHQRVGQIRRSLDIHGLNINNFFEFLFLLDKKGVTNATS